ncbi:MAG: hypothetical protein SF052_18635 [Bacteroidia bacterium]|nr:hypothetical protein [Bacteroidia bacterium]
MNGFQACFILAYDLFTGGIAAVSNRLKIWQTPVPRSIPMKQQDIIHRIERNNQAEQQFLITSLSLLTTAVLWAAFLPLMIFGQQYAEKKSENNYYKIQYEVLRQEHPTQYRVRLHPSPAPLSPCKKKNASSFYEKDPFVFPGGYIEKD